VVVNSIDGIRLDKHRRNCFPDYSYVSYPAFNLGITPPPTVVVARACLNNDCSTCTDYEEIPWGGAGHYVRHDFILPVLAPTITQTPTITETPTASDTPTITETSTPTETPISTDTPEPTATPTDSPTVTATQPMRSDLNLDNQVNAEDLLILLTDWKKVSGP
jgi:hypothetical protein